MPQWSEVFQNHELHTTLRSFQTSLDEIDQSSIKEIEAIESIDRLREALKFLEVSLSKIEPNLVSDTRLNTINNVLQEQIGQINNFKSNSNVAHLTNATRNIDNLFTQMAPLPILKTTEEVEGLRDATASFRRSVGQHARNLEAEYEKVHQQFEDINQRFSDFKTEVTSQKSRLDTAISEFQKQFSDAESQRREQYSTESSNTRAELNRVVQAGKEQVESLAATFREEFDTAETERKTEYEARFESTKSSLTTLLDKGKKDLLDLTEQHKETFNSLVTETKESRKTMEVDFKTEVDAYIAQLELRKGEAEKLVQVIGNTGMVGGYQKIADQERRAAWIWHGVTFAFMIGLVIFAIIAFHSTIQGDFKLGTFGARAFVAIAFGLGVAWAARQADKHQDVERRSRKMELELASINPYLALLPDETQFSVKTELAKRFFGQSDPIPESKNDKQVTGSALDLLRMALEMLAKKS